MRPPESVDGEAAANVDGETSLARGWWPGQDGPTLCGMFVCTSAQCRLECRLALASAGPSCGCRWRGGVLARSAGLPKMFAAVTLGVSGLALRTRWRAATAMAMAMARGSDTVGKAAAFRTSTDSMGPASTVRARWLLIRSLLIGLDRPAPTGRPLPARTPGSCRRSGTPSVVCDWDVRSRGGVRGERDQQKAAASMQGGVVQGGYERANVRTYGRWRGW